MGARTVQDYLGQKDLNRLQRVFTDGLKLNDLQAVYYSSLNLKDLDIKESADLCSKLQTLYEESKLNVRNELYLLSLFHLYIFYYRLMKKIFI